MPKMRSRSVTGTLRWRSILTLIVAVNVGLELEPCAAIRDDLCAKKLAAAIRHGGEVHARRTHELRNDDALDAVHDERAARGHDREIAEVHLLLVLVSGAVVHQAKRAAKRRLIRRFFIARGRLVVLRFVKTVVGKIKFEFFAGVVADRRDLLEHFVQTFFEEPLVRLQLRLVEVVRGDERF